MTWQDIILASGIPMSLEIIGETLKFLEFRFDLRGRAVIGVMTNRGAYDKEIPLADASRYLADALKSGMVPTVESYSDRLIIDLDPEVEG